MKQYNVTGMSCAACSARVEKAVSKVPGVTACSVSLLTNSMGVEGAASPQAVIAAVEDAGYGASEKGAASIAACNRSPERAQHLARDFGVTVVDYADRYAAIAASDIVVSATASPHVVVERARLALTHPVMFLDLAAPHDVEPSVADLPGATVLSLETIGELARGDRDERAALLAASRVIVSEAVAKTAAWLNTLGGVLYSSSSAK